MIKTLAKINVQGHDIWMKKIGKEDYICLSDMVNGFGKEDSIKNRLRNKDTIEFLWTREKLHNSDFNEAWFLELRSQSWTSRFVLSPQKWKENTNAIWIQSTPWKWWWTYAHLDIALEFAAHLNPAFKLFLIKDYQRLKNEEQYKLETNWDFKRWLTKINYGFMTDSIQTHLIPHKLDSKTVPMIYAEEADLINLALFNITAQQRRETHIKESKEWYNMRDFATPEQLVVLTNLEFKNSEMITDWIPQSERLMILNKLAIQQMTKLTKKQEMPILPNPIETLQIGKENER